MEEKKINSDLDIIKNNDISGKDRFDFLQKTAFVWIGALICCLLWGSAFPCIKLGYDWMSINNNDTATIIMYAGCRFTLAGILAIVFGSFLNKKLLIPGKSAIPKIINLSLFQTILQYFFFYIGLAHTSGVKASIIEGMNVFIAIFVSSILFKQETLTGRKVFGSIIGFAGVVLVNVLGQSVDISLSFWGEGFILLSVIAYAFSSVFIKHYSKLENPVMLSGWQFLFGGIVMTIAGFVFGGHFESVSVKSILMLIYLAFISAAAYSLWSLLLKYNPVSKVTVFGFMNPVFGVILSSVLLNEKDMINAGDIFSLVLVCLGIYIVNSNKKNNPSHEK